MIQDLVMKLNAVGLRKRGEAQAFGNFQWYGAPRCIGTETVAFDPQLIMYDEPFAGLDPISMGVTATLIRNLNNALGSTTILVSHDVHETFVIADYVYFLSQGKIVAQRTPKMLESADPYVKQFACGT